MAVSHEFTHWWLAGPRHEFSDEALAWPGSTEELERHLAGPELRCQHGPADEWKMSW